MEARTEPRTGPLSRRMPAPALVLCSVVSIQIGQALGKHLFGSAGPMGVVALRLGFSAVLLCALWRPRLPADRRERLLVVAFGTAIAGMNVIYLALRYLPLGVAVAIQLLGPLAVVLLTSRRLRDLLWGLLAGAGLLLFTAPSLAGDPGAGRSLPAAGVVLALAGAVAMGAYLLLSRRAGRLAVDGSPLALAVAWAALLWVPAGVAESGTRLARPEVLLVGLAVAVLSAAGPYSLELAALRRLPPRVVGVLQNLEPVAAGLAGLAVLGEMLSSAQWTAVCCITAAAVGAVITQGRAAPAGGSPGPGSPSRRGRSASRGRGTPRPVPRR
ncbi:Threonine_homoserine exporter RhtA [Streptomyces sp. enrichment culture]|uniref:EamA family transporter n=1 Tax=Streptomyces sp. enrichment culture TaxID=1795815 RepID=UPI003F578FF9